MRLLVPVKKIVIVCAVIMLAVVTFHHSAVAAEKGKWTGVDETVVEKYAREHGREAREPFINTDQGDLLLFVFLVAGTLGGFVAGYSWRRLMERKTPQQEHGGGSRPVEAVKGQKKE